MLCLCERVRRIFAALRFDNEPCSSGNHPKHIRSIPQRLFGAACLKTQNGSEFAESRFELIRARCWRKQRSYIVEFGDVAAFESKRADSLHDRVSLRAGEYRLDSSYARLRSEQVSIICKRTLLQVVCEILLSPIERDSGRKLQKPAPFKLLSGCRVSTLGQLRDSLFVVAVAPEL